MVAKGILGEESGWALSSATSDARMHALAGGHVTPLPYDEPASSSTSCRFTVATKS
jgi:hypothetical protein